MSRRVKIILGVGAGALVAAIVIQNVRTNREKVFDVETAEVVYKDLAATVSASGRIQPQRLVDVSANTMGKIVRLAVREGDAVEKGDFLLEIDPTPYETAARGAEAALAAAEANLKLAQAQEEEARVELERVRDLAVRGFTTEREVTQAKTTYDVQSARTEAAGEEVVRARELLRAARHDLSKVRIVSEISGVITRLNVEEGENAVTGTMNNPGTVLLTIADLSILEAEVKVDETDVVDVAVNQRAEVEIDAFPDTTYWGTVTEVGNSPMLRGDIFGEQAADFKVVVTLDDAVPQARPGLSATAEITTATRDSVLAIPIPSLTLREVSRAEASAEDTATAADGSTSTVVDSTAREEETEGATGDVVEKEGVFVVGDDHAGFRPVRTGIAGEKDFEVLKGLEAGEVVVTGDFKALRELEDGDRVKVKKKKKEED